ncbi:MAG: exodeoxyribonuclease III [Phycisphaerae bacterium]|nr:exodeoxyribonuclease III [Phycisphaerae bacterium]
MKIATFNVNSIRSRIDPVRQWLCEHQPDVLAVQETKVQDDEFPLDAFAGIGYHVIFRGQKKYNGVALFSRLEPENVVDRLPGDDGGDARFLQADYGDITIVNTYVPQGREMHSDAFAYKLAFFRCLQAYFVEQITPTSKWIWVGDLNVAREAIDVHDPERLWGTVCFCQEVQDALESVVSAGLIDLFRLHHPGRPGLYTFWDYRVPNGFKRNLGWRLDYLMATASLADRCTRCEIDTACRGADKPSDHTVLWAEVAISPCPPKKS